MPKSGRTLDGGVAVARFGLGVDRTSSSRHLTITMFFLLVLVGEVVLLAESRKIRIPSGFTNATHGDPSDGTYSK